MSSIDLRPYSDRFDTEITTQKTTDTFVVQTTRHGHTLTVTSTLPTDSTSEHVAVSNIVSGSRWAIDSLTPIVFPQRPKKARNIYEKKSMYGDALPALLTGIEANIIERVAPSVWLAPVLENVWYVGLRFDHTRHWGALPEAENMPQKLEFARYSLLQYGRPSSEDGIETYTMRDPWGSAFATLLPELHDETKRNGGYAWCPDRETTCISQTKPASDWLTQSDRATPVFSPHVVRLGATLELAASGCHVVDVIDVGFER